jgi:tripartite-type tricarboxylate transporter receptor subunit TctC
VVDFSNALAKVVASRMCASQLTAMGLTVGYMTPQQLTNRQNAYTQAWSRIIKNSGFQPQ